MGNQLNDGVEHLETDDYVYLARVLKNNFQLKCITLTGGDPFLYRDFSSLVKKLKNLEIELVALTKGAPAHKWLDNEPEVFRDLDFVYFSIDTLDRNEFSKTCRVNPSVFDVGIAALDKLISMGIKVRVNCVVKSNCSKEAKKVSSMIDFVKTHGVQELRFIELVDIDNIKEPFVEQALSKAGVIAQIPQKPYDIKSLKRIKYTLSDGFEFLVLRCMCSVTLYTGEITCFNQDLYLDSFGRINTCLEWEVDKNPNVANIAQYIKLRDTDGLIKALNSIKSGLHVCPAIASPKQREELNAGLQLGTYR